MRVSRDRIEIGAAELSRRLEAGEPLQVLDVRAPERLANGIVSPVAPDRYVNINFWVHDGAFAGAFNRAASGQIVNVHQGGGLMPVFFVSEKL